VENVTEVMGEVGHWERVFIRGLEIPYPKLQESKRLSTSEREKSQSLVRYWVNTAPDASWLVLGHALYNSGEEAALAMVKQYLPKRMCIFGLCEIGLVFCGVYILMIHTNTHWPTCVVIVYSNAWIFYLSVHVPIVTHDHNHIMVAMQET